MMHTTWVLACSRLMVNKDDQESGCGTNGTSGMWLKKKIREGALSYFFHQISLLPRTLLRSTPLTESLKQATWFRIPGSGLKSVFNFSHNYLSYVYNFDPSYFIIVLSYLFLFLSFYLFIFQLPFFVFPSFLKPLILYRVA